MCIRDRFNALGENYKVKFDPKTIVLNSVNYGVPQLRKRVIIIGVRKDIDIDVDDMYNGIIKTHFAPDTNELDRSSLKKFVTVRDAIEELPPLHPGEGSPLLEFSYKRNNEFLNFIRCY